MGTLREDIESGADWIATALTSSGYAADFSPASLWRVDKFFDEHTRDGKALPGGLLSESLGSRLFALGGYLGEVIRRTRGGEWIVPDEKSPSAEIDITLRLDDGAEVWPVQRMMKRLESGAEESIGAYGLVLGLDVGPAPSRRRRQWWRFW